MRGLSVLIISLVILVSSSALAQDKESEEPATLTANWTKIKKKEYSMAYPPHWRMNQRLADGVDVVLYAPNPSSSDGFATNINLTVQDLSDRKLDLNSYTRLSERQIHTLVENSTMIKSERIDTTDVPFHQIIYTGDYNATKLKWIMRFWVVKKHAYILTYTSLKDDFGLHSEAAQHIMDTFELK